MKTSRENRLEEWAVLNRKNINGVLASWKDINRWRELREEFQPRKKSANEAKTSEKG